MTTDANVKALRAAGYEVILALKKRRLRESREAVEPALERYTVIGYPLTGRMYRIIPTSSIFSISFRTSLCRCHRGRLVRHKNNIRHRLQNRHPHVSNRGVNFRRRQGSILRAV